MARGYPDGFDMEAGLEHIWMIDHRDLGIANFSSSIQTMDFCCRTVVMLTTTIHLKLPRSTYIEQSVYWEDPEQHALVRQ